MVALNFKAQFAADVEAGRKRRTIRAPRKDGRTPKVGDQLQLYTGMRQSACRKLLDAECVRVRTVTIDRYRIILDGKELQGGPARGFDPEEFDSDFAEADGFGSFTEMVRFFEKTHGLPFTGHLIEWR